MVHTRAARGEWRGGEHCSYGVKARHGDGGGGGGTAASVSPRGGGAHTTADG